MELDDLKKAWTALDNRLKRNEELKESIILEMMQHKVDKLVKRWLYSSIFGVCIVLFLIPFVVYSLEKYGGSIWFNVLGYLTIIFCIASLICALSQIRLLIKIDFTESISNNIINLNKYDISGKRFLIAVYFYTPISFILAAARYAELHVTLSLWTFLIGIGLFVNIFAICTIKIYNKNFKSIIKSMNEIKELKEE